MKASEYLPIGSVVALDDGIKKIMIIGIMQEIRQEDEVTEKFDYIGVAYPEGFINTGSMLLFNHDQIMDVVYRGYENIELNLIKRKSILSRVLLLRKFMFPLEDSGNCSARSG